MEDRTGCQRGLFVTPPALPTGLPVQAKAHRRGGAAMGADEALRPARLHQRRFALSFGAITFEELAHTQAGLELHYVLAHDPLRTRT